MFKKSIYLYFLLMPIIILSQENKAIDSLTSKSSKNLKFNYKQLIIPSAFITYGIVSIESDYLKSLNLDTKNELAEHIDKRFTIDDFSQYLPAASVYGLNLLGVKGKNNFKDRSIILGTSYLIMSATVLSLKSISKIERPDGSANNSFPSGHTANAFAGAEFLYQEYKDVNIWYGISGYAVATATGFFRMYNQRHWFSDVVMGAGIGILSTKIAYWLHPYMKQNIFKTNQKSTAIIAPFYNGKQGGLGLVIHIN